MQPIRCSPIIILAGVVLFYGCGNQNLSTGSALTRVSAYPKAIANAQKNKQYMMLHSGVNLYSVVRLEVHKKTKEITLQLDNVDSTHVMNTSGNDAMKNQANQEKMSGNPPLHLYMTDSVSYTLDEPHTVPLKRIARISAGG